MRSDFLNGEDGGIGAWSLFVFLTCAIIAGLAVDGTNALRAREHLQSTADIAAHAGVVELAAGGTEQEIRERVTDIVELNLPKGTFGNTLGVSADSIVVGSYQDGTVTSGAAAPDDAVFVSLAFSQGAGNAVPTFLLKLVGLSSWDIAASSAAMLGEIASCNGNDGIYAQGEIKLTSISEIGADFCVYSKDLVELSNHNEFLDGARIGMPDIADCKQCTDAHNPGVEKAKFEGNILLEDVSEHIDAVMASLLGTSDDETPVSDFTNGVLRDTDMAALDDLGYQTNKIKLGSVVSISASDFEAMSRVPTGVIYAVYCGKPLEADGALSPTGAACTGKGKKSDCSSGSGNVKTLSLETGSGESISDVAIVTDCQIKFGKSAYIVNSVVVTSSTSNQSISAFSNARIGSSLLACPSTEKVVVMTKGDMSVPAGMETNNVDFHVAGDVHLASGTSTQASKLGTSFYVGGEMHISAQGKWHACGDKPDSYAGGLESIRQVIASRD